MLPDVIIQRIITDSIILHKDELGWKTIHNRLKNYPLYVKQTVHSKIIYEGSVQVRYHFQLSRPYLWLKPMMCSQLRFYGYHDEWT